MTKFEKVEEVLVYRCDAGFDGDRANWYDFSNGSNVGDSEINRWMQELFVGIRADLVKGIDKTFGYMRSGNTLVLLTAFRQDDGSYELSFVVTKNYKVADYIDYDPSVDVDFVPLEPNR